MRFWVPILVVALVGCSGSEPAPAGDPARTPSDARGDPIAAGDPVGDPAGDPGGDPAGDPNPGPDEDPAVSDFSGTGPFSVTSADGSTTVNGCGLDYTLYQPSGQGSAPLMVLGHGFQRDRSNMADLAEHVASWGLRVVAPSYCHSSILDADHEQNGLDAAALSAELAAGADVVHAGYSAGGGSAFVAAANDPATVGVMGLDAVDSDDMAATAAATLTVPVFGLAGPSNSCNSSNNGLPAYAAAANGWAARVTGAGHCDFEAPTSYLGCEILCGGADAGRQALVAAMLAAFGAWATGVDATGADWVEPTGANYGELVASGSIEPL